MAWLVDVRIEEFSMQLVWGPAGKYPLGKQNRFEPRLRPENVPKRVILDRDVSECAKFVLCRGGGQWIVSQRFRDIVEGLEPGIHNWLPTKLVVNSTEVQQEPYYFFQHGFERDSITLERTMHRIVKKHHGGEALVIKKKEEIPELFWTNTKPKVATFGRKKRQPIATSTFPMS